jgi:hypothetical protein
MDLLHYWTVAGAVGLFGSLHHQLKDRERRSFSHRSCCGWWEGLARSLGTLVTALTPGAKRGREMNTPSGVPTGVPMTPSLGLSEMGAVHPTDMDIDVEDSLALDHDAPAERTDENFFNDFEDDFDDDDLE